MPRKHFPPTNDFIVRWDHGPYVAQETLNRKVKRALDLIMRETSSDLISITFHDGASWSAQRHAS